VLITRCSLTLHDSLFFATREMGTLYETERYIHNYALSYALFNDSVIKVPYFCASYRPTYANDLGKLTERDIYVTPARPLNVSFILVTWKMGQVTYHRNPEKFGGRNYPMNFGRAKEIAPESEFEFFVVSREPQTLPRWIRLGKWASKAFVKPIGTWKAEQKHGEYVSSSPLNPLDISTPLGIYDLISMPPVSLIQNTRLNGAYIEADSGRVKLPAEMKFTFAP
jgi:CRISPR-associated protein Csc1